MRIKQIPQTHVSALCLFMMAALLVSCAPSTSPTTSETESQSPPSVNLQTEATPAALGCSAGGPAVFTPEDVGCYLAKVDPVAVQRIDEDMFVLLADPENIADWAGAAIVYHIPTVSTLVLDQFGDVDPQASLFSSRAGLAAFDELAADVRVLVDLKQQVLSKRETSPANEPEIRLSEAWQDSSTTFFAVSIAGLGAADGRFYCPGETWTIGDETFEIAADCMAQEPGTPVSHFFFTSQTIKGSEDRPVQLALDGVPSNIVQVREGMAAQETAIYQAVLGHSTNRPIIVFGETVSGYDEDLDKLAAAVDPGLLENYQAVNESPHSLRFLFQGSSAYSVQPGATIARDYLPAGDLQLACTQFRGDYPGLGGIVTLSRIGVRDDGAQALVHSVYECGPADRLSAYYILNEMDDGWQVTDTISAARGLPILGPEMVFNNSAEGCGDIFVYRSNPAG